MVLSTCDPNAVPELDIRGGSGNSVQETKTNKAEGPDEVTADLVKVLGKSGMKWIKVVEAV